MKRLLKNYSAALLGFIAVAAFSMFGLDSFANQFNQLGEFLTSNCLTLDTVAQFCDNPTGGSAIAGAAALATLRDTEGNEFETKSKEDIEKMEEADAHKYYEQLTEFQNKNIIYLQEQIEKGKTENKQEVEKQITELVKAANETLIERVKELGKRVEIQAKELTSKEVSKENKLVEELKSKKDELQSIKTGQNSEGIEIKALTLRSAITDNESAVDLPDIGQLATRKLSMMDLFPKLTVGTGTHDGTVRYYDWDADTTVRAAAMIAEGAAFPESTAKWQKYSIELKKVGDSLPVTEEFFEDEVMFANELEMFLMTNMDLKIDDQICNGDNTGQNLKGLFNSVPAFVPGNVEPVADASIYDLLVSAQEQITITGGAKYKPDFAVMNKKLINKMKLKKDANNNYVIPPFVSRDGKVVDGLLVIEANVVPDNQLVLGDRRFGRIYEMPGMTIARGFVGTQFTEDEITLKVRKRLLFLIRNIDATGFVKITDVDAALVAITAT